MANTARITQDAVELFTTQSGTVFITQNAIELPTGAGVTCGNPPAGTIGQPYNHTFPAGGGTPPYTFSISAGSLPTGMTLDPATGIVSGSPTTAGVFNFTITVLDTMGTTSGVACSITVAALLGGINVGGGPLVIPKPCRCDVGDSAYDYVRMIRERQREWPYTWNFPPPGAIRVTAQKTIPIPTVAAGETEGLLFVVDQGFLFALESLVVQPYAGASVNPGSFKWSLDVNRPVGVPNVQAAGIQGLSSVDIPLGSIEFAWPLVCPDVFSPNDALRIKFFNVSLTPGAPRYFKSILMGWRWAVG